MDKTSLGDRMKKHENVYRQYLTPRMPVIIRVDGRSFSSYTKGFDRPFDFRIINAMVYAANKVAEDIQGFQVAYIQSDEASFCFHDYTNLQSEGWFGYNLNKIVSISASLMTIHFNAYIGKTVGRELDDTMSVIYDGDYKIALFDSRAFNVPREEVSNYFLFRSKDNHRNSLSSYAQSIFSHKQLHKKNQNDIHEMLHEKGKNWTIDLKPVEKNGTFLIKDENGAIQERTDIKDNYQEIAEVVDPLINPEYKPYRVFDINCTNTVQID